MKIQCMLLVLVLCAVLPSQASAYYGASLDVSSGIEQICPCDIVSSDELLIEIKNYGTSSDTYHMSMQLPEDWSGFIQPEITLASGETGVVSPVWITASCGSTSPGSYTVFVKAESGMSGKEYTEELDLYVMTCHDVAITGETYVQTCENEAVTAEIVIENPGKMDENYILSASPEWAVIYPDTVSVDASEAETVSLTMLPPADMKGIQDVTIRAESAISYAEAEKEIRLSIEPCYVFDAGLSPPSDTVCIGTEAVYMLNIDNLGTKADTYTIATPNWISPEMDAVYVGSGERESVKITAIPPLRGETQVLVSVTSETKPTAVVDAVSTVTAVDCRSVAVSLSPATRDVCRGDDTSFVARVENTGTVVTSYQLTSSMGTLDRTKVVLGPGGVENVIVNIDSAMDVGSWAVSVLAYDENVSDEDAAILNVHNCYDASLEVSPMETSACRGDTLSYEIVVKNTGDLQDDYILEYYGEEHEFGLESGESRTIDARIPVNHLWDSENEMPVVLSSSNGVHIEKAAKINVGKKEKCYSVVLDIVNGNETKSKETDVVVCNAVTVKLKIGNMGLRTDEYRIVVDGPDWAHISKDSFYLVPLQEEEFYLYLSPPYETEEKEYRITIMADSEKALSGVEISAMVLKEPREGADLANETGNFTQADGLTGLFLWTEEVPIEAISVSAIAIAAAFILILRFVIFK